MDYGSFSDYQVEQWLAGLSPGYAALHSDNPRVAGNYASEVFGGSYVRAQCFLTDPSNRGVWNTNDLSWTGLPAVMITHIALWDAQFNGNLLLSAPLTDPLRMLKGARWELGSGEFAISFRDIS